MDFSRNIFSILIIVHLVRPVWLDWKEIQDLLDLKVYLGRWVVQEWMEFPETMASREKQEAPESSECLVWKVTEVSQEMMDLKVIKESRAHQDLEAYLDLKDSQVFN